jgi:HlyD family secretion protein
MNTRRHKVKPIYSALIVMAVAALLAGCSDNTKKSDAYGNFEATEVLISAEASGKLIKFNIEEGDTIQKGTAIGFIDTVQLYLKKDQLIATKLSAKSKLENIASQIAVIEEQKQNSIVDKNRIDNLYKANAATKKQVDDINGQIKVFDKQVGATLTQKSSILNDMKSLDVQIAQIQDQIDKSRIINPVNGTVLTKMAQENEITSYGKALYKIADLNNIYLRIYISGDQLAKIKLGQKVKVLVDADAKNNRQLTGEISWISSKTEFTPKIIQTKDERVNMVYAVKVRVANDGSLKIGMPGEVNF